MKKKKYAFLNHIHVVRDNNNDNIDNEPENKNNNNDEDIIIIINKQQLINACSFVDGNNIDDAFIHMEIILKIKILILLLLLFIEKITMKKNIKK